MARHRLASKFFANLCRAIGCEELAALQYDDEAQPRLRAALAERFRSRTRDEWVAELAGADTCVAPVLEVGEVVADTQFSARRVVGVASHPQHGDVRQLAPLLAGMPRGQEAVTLPDMALSDTEHLLKEAGVDGGTLARWVAAGVVA
jgi:alpha-methylacyl-CoA racemase